MTRPKANYFGAGPALLPTPVLEQAAKDLLTYLGNDVGVGEISHRSKDGIDIINDTKASLTEILSIPDTHEVFFLQGGGTLGFSTVVTNLAANYALRTNKKPKLAYAVTGSWSKKAYEESKRLGFDSEVVTNGIDGKYIGIKPVEKWNPVDKENTAFLYYCDNETVNGVEFLQPPVAAVSGSNVEIVADMSSNFLSKKIDVSQYGLIFAGAQKNVGIAGIVVYIIKKSLIDQPTTEVLNKLSIPITPIAFHFPTVIKNNSAYNTIPIFAVRVLQLVLDHLINQIGGLGKQEQINKKKAQLLYDTLDKYPQLFHLIVAKDVRSKMNVVFTLEGGLRTEAKFIQEAAESANLTGLKGHRSVGGIRASIYNAIDLETVQKLVSFIEMFAKTTSV